MKFRERFRNLTLSRRRRSSNANDEAEELSITATKPEEESREQIGQPTTIQLSSSVNQVALTPDGCFAAVAKESPLSNDSTYDTTASVFAWQKNVGLRSSHPSHDSSVRAIALSSDGVYAASGDYNGNVAVWDAKTGQGTWNLTHTRPVSSLTLTHGGDTLVSSASDGAVFVCDTVRQVKRRELAHHVDVVSSCEIDVTGLRVFTSSWDGALCEWDLRQRDPIFVFAPYRRRSILDASVDFYWRTYLTVGADNSAALLDARMRDRIYTVNLSGSALSGCAIAKNGSRCAVSGQHGSLHVWPTSNNSAITPLVGHDQKTRVNSVHLNGDGTRLVSGGNDKSVLFWELERVPQELAHIDLPGDEESYSHVSVQSAAVQMYIDFMNYGSLIQAAALKNAIIFDHNRGALTSLADMVMVHMLVKTCIRSSKELTSLFGNDTCRRNDFLYLKVYHRLVPLLTNEREREFGYALLHDARALGVLAEGDVRSIMGDNMTYDYVQNELEQMRTVQAEILESVQNRVLTLEERVRQISTDVSNLRESMHNVTVQMERDARVRRWAMLVKLGTSLIPLAGSLATGIVDAGTELFLSFDVQSLVDLVANTVTLGAQGIADIVPEVITTNTTPELADISEEEVLKVRLATLMTNPMFLNNPRVDGDTIRSVIASAYGHDVETLSHDIQAILKEVIAANKHETNEETGTDMNDAQNNDS